MNEKRITLSLALLPVVSALYGQKAQTDKPDSRPNIIFIMSDDHARQAMSIYGHPIGKIAPTPNIDRIGNEGATFYNNYCCNSISGPSRAAILTGKHSHKNGFMKNWAKGFDATSSNTTSTRKILSSASLPRELLHTLSEQSAKLAKTASSPPLSPATRMLPCRKLPKFLSK